MDRVSDSAGRPPIEIAANCNGRPGMHPRHPPSSTGATQGPRPTAAPLQPTPPRIPINVTPGRNRITVFADRPPGILPTPAPHCNLSQSDCLQQTIQYHLAEVWDILNPDCSLNRCLTSYPIPYQPSDTGDPRFDNVRPVINQAREAYTRLSQLVAPVDNNQFLTREMVTAAVEARELLKRLQLQVLHMPASESRVRVGFQMLRDLFNTIANLIEARGPQRDPLVPVLVGLTRSVSSYHPNPSPPRHRP